MARLKYDKVAAVTEFADCLGLIPGLLITKEVVELITRSWEREFQKEYFSDLEKQQAKEFIIKLSERGKRRRHKPILDNMTPINFSPLYEDVHTAHKQED